MTLYKVGDKVRVINMKSSFRNKIGSVIKMQRRDLMIFYIIKFDVPVVAENSSSIDEVMFLEVEIRSATE